MKTPLLVKTTASLALLLAAAFSSPRAMAGNAPDLDLDGIPNVVDTDIDGDGIPNALDTNVDGGICKSGPMANRYIGDHLDNDNAAEKDIDGDGLNDDSLGEKDTDGDGKADSSTTEMDIDGDRRPDDSLTEKDIDGDGDKDESMSEDDIDGDGYSDDDDAEMDIDGDNRSDDEDDDIDGDGKSNGEVTEDDADGDGRRAGATEESDDDGDGLNNRQDLDDNNDGVEDNDDPAHRNEEDEAELETQLIVGPTAFAGSRATAKVQRMANGKVELEVSGRGWQAGIYVVSVDGQTIGEISITKDSAVKQVWETNANRPTEINLTIPVLGKAIHVRDRAGAIMFCGTLPYPPESNVQEVDGNVTLRRNFSLGSSAPISALGRLVSIYNERSLRTLSLTVEGLANGVYALSVGESEVANFTVGDDGVGELQFSVTPKRDSPALPLNFAASGMEIKIHQGSEIMLEGNIPLSPLDTPGIIIANMPAQATDYQSSDNRARDSDLEEAVED